MAPMAQKTAKYFLSSLTQNTQKAYNKAWLEFDSYISKLDPWYPHVPINNGHVSFYITYLFDLGYSVATISSKLSAITYMFQAQGKPDPVSSYFVKRLLVGLRKLRPQQDTRLPLTVAMLDQILTNVYKMGFTYYEQVMFRAIIALSFAAFLRPCEVTGSANNLLIQNLIFNGDVMILQFTHYKHAAGKPFTLYINPTGKKFCPSKLMKRYLAMRGHYVGPLFCRLNGMPLSYSKFRDMFKTALAYLGLPGQMSLHSIRIGAATYAAACGVADSVIKRWGRWRSDAYKNYIRLPTFQV